jgi:hypothetical protein
MTHFDTMDTIVKQFFDNLPKVRLAYCDYIAHLIQGNLKANDTEKMLSSVGRTQYDTDPSGSFASTKKTIMVEDRNGKQYKITVEEV